MSLLCSYRLELLSSALSIAAKEKREKNLQGQSGENERHGKRDVGGIERVAWNIGFLFLTAHFHSSYLSQSARGMPACAQLFFKSHTMGSGASQSVKGAEQCRRDFPNTIEAQEW